MPPIGREGRWLPAPRACAATGCGIGAVRLAEGSYVWGWQGGGGAVGGPQPAHKAAKGGDVTTVVAPSAAIEPRVLSAVRLLQLLCYLRHHVGAQRRIVEGDVPEAGWDSGEAQQCTAGKGRQVIVVEHQHLQRWVVGDGLENHLKEVCIVDAIVGQVEHLHCCGYLEHFEVKEHGFVLI